MEVKAEHTVRKILKWVFIIMVIILVLLWFIGGGWGKIVDKARGFHFTSLGGLLSSAGTSTLSNFHLPWQISMPQIAVQGVSDMYPQDGSGAPQDGGPPSGGPSSSAGQIDITEGAARTQSSAGQYIELTAAPGNGVPVSISGWSLESAVSGTRVVIPQGTPLFIMGTVNPISDITLAPGGRVIISTGPSPVGVSFRENECTGYLGTLQPFVPALSSQCPAPLSSIPATSANVARLGASCFDYLKTLPPCTFPQNPPSSLTPACRAQIQNTLSYNGCAAQNKNAPGFAFNSWRVYLAQGAPLWSAQHDIIRLLDSAGRIVNSITY